MTRIDTDNMLRSLAVSDNMAKKRCDLSSKREKLIKDMDRATDLLTAAYTHHVSGVLSETEFNVARAKFENDKQAAHLELARVEKQISAYDSDKMRESDCLAQFRKYNGFVKLDKDIVSALIKRIEFTPFTNDISITFNYKDSFDNLTRMIAESEVYDDE
jgi:hypothetical protein